MGAATATESPFLTVRAVAALLEKSEPRVYQMIAAGELPAARLGRRRLVIPREAFDEWLAEKNAQALAAVAESTARARGGGP